MKTPSFEEIVKQVILNPEKNYLKQIDNMGLTDDFWKLCKATFEYESEKPNINDLAVSLMQRRPDIRKNGALKWNTIASGKIPSVYIENDDFPEFIQLRVDEEKTRRTLMLLAKNEKILILANRKSIISTYC